MESELGDLAGSFQQWSEHLNNQKQLLKTEIDRLKTFQQDHNALEKQLKTLPDKTTRSVMASYQHWFTLHLSTNKQDRSPLVV